MTKKFTKSGVAAIITYLTSKLLLSKKIENNENLKDISNENLSRIQNLKKLVSNIMKSKVFKIAVLVFGLTLAINMFFGKLIIAEILKILGKQTDDLKLPQEMIHDLNLYHHTQSIKTLLANENLSERDRISLLKIRLDFLVNGEAIGKESIVVLSILIYLLGLTSNLGKLYTFLAALFRLFKKGRISKDLYMELLGYIIARGVNVPPEYIPEQ